MLLTIKHNVRDIVTNVKYWRQTYGSVMGKFEISRFRTSFENGAPVNATRREIIQVTIFFSR